MGVAPSATPQVGTTLDKPAKIKHRRFSRREKIFAVVMSVILLAVCFAWIYPFIWMFSASFKNNAEIFGSLSPFNAVLRVKNWTEAWTDAEMGLYFFNSVFIP